MMVLGYKPVYGHYLPILLDVEGGSSDYRFY